MSDKQTTEPPDWWEACLAWRGVDKDDACVECGGAGTKAYGNTSTWRGGVGGNTITTDVCNVCWGSGSKSRPWPSWKNQRGGVNR